MNLKRIEIYQNGIKVATLSRADEEMFEKLQLSELPESVNKSLITLAQLIDPDEDGHPEVLEAKVITPVYDKISIALIRQGYYLAMREIAGIVSQGERDSITLDDILKLVNDFDDAERLKKSIDLKVIQL